MLQRSKANEIFRTRELPNHGTPSSLRSDRVDQAPDVIDFILVEGLLTSQLSVEMLDFHTNSDLQPVFIVL